MLAILFDLGMWQLFETQVEVTLEKFLEHVLIFLRAYLLQKDGVMASVFLVDGCGAHLLGSSVVPLEEHSREDLCDFVNRNIQKMIENGEIVNSGEPNWGSGLLQSLCHIRKQKQLSNGQHVVDGNRGSLRVEESENSRILSIVTSRDDTSHYLSFMNAVFGAQRENVTIDACIMTKNDSSLFQQGCLLSKGFYFKPRMLDMLLQYLLTAYVAEPSSRGRLRYPARKGVDFRASCFCHKKPLDIGFVCSVCLSVFCQEYEACLTCGSEFKT
eukprot:jgi/Picsp_1/2630/NSC_00860-R1_general transcription factor iih subunit 3-like